MFLKDEMRQTIAIPVLNTVIQMHDSYIYIYIYILFLVLLFHLNISTVKKTTKKGSGFEIVENKCIFVHQR